MTIPNFDSYLEAPDEAIVLICQCGDEFDVPAQFYDPAFEDQYCCDRCLGEADADRRLAEEKERDFYPDY